MVIIRKHGISAFRVSRLMVYVVGRGHVVTWSQGWWRHCIPTSFSHQSPTADTRPQFTGIQALQVYL